MDRVIVNDGALSQDTKSEHRRELEELYRSCREELGNFIAGRVSDPEDAEDILHNVFLKMHDSLTRLTSVRNLRAWLYRTARNAIIDYYRTRTVEPQMSVEPGSEPPAEQPDFTEPDVRGPLTGSLHEMIGKLPPKYRVPLELHEFHGLTQQEVARQLSLSVPGAKSRIQRARAKLREMLFACCHFELDRRGGIVNYEPACRSCSGAA